LLASFGGRGASESTIMSDKGTNWSAKTWAQWVEDRVRRRAETFVNEPEEMVAAYERERRNIDDYRGRVILELLQNADDAGVGYGANKALIRCWPEGVCVANTGVPFSVAGVESLMVSNFSPKKLDRSRHIGNRGLGFRSVLSWTDCPFVLSGGLALAFSPVLSATLLERLVTRNDRVRTQVQEWRAAGHPNPLPILAAPMAIGELSDLPRPAQATASAALWSHAVALRQEYNTVVALPFTEGRAAQQAAEEVDQLPVELLLFLQHLEEVVIEDQEARRTWRANRSGERVLIEVDGEGAESSAWHVYVANGTLPQELLGPGERSTPAFEIKIAVPEQVAATSVLYSYFPTKVRFPYPVVAHATLQLTSNRQNLVDSAANKFLARRLAEQLANVAEQIADREGKWAGLRLISSRGTSTDAMLEQLGFESALRQAAKTKRLIPRRDGQLASASAVRQLAVNPDGWLPLRGFGDLVLWSEQYWVRDVLERLGVEDLRGEELKGRIEDQTAHLGMEQRVALIAGLVQHSQNLGLTESGPPQLLLDADGKPIGTETAAYFPPASDKSFEVPPWLPVRFVARALVDGLAEKLAQPRERLAERLRDSGYQNVHEYDFRGLARALIAEVNRRCREGSTQAGAVRIEGLHALKNLWTSAGSEQAPQKEVALRVDLPTRTGEWRSADELYLGEPYPKGVLMHSLLGARHPEQFVAEPAALGADDVVAWQDFLLWLGVADCPRLRRAKLDPWSNPGYIEHVRQHAPYPMQFDEFTVATPDQLNLECVGATSLEHLEEMLENTDPHALVAWVALDSRLEGWRRHLDRQARLEARFKVYTYRESEHPTPSYVLWLLREIPWLLGEDGERHAPHQCVLAKVTSAELRKVFPRPAIDPEADILSQLQVDHEALTAALMRIGVRMSLDELSWEQCYDLLLRLPEIDPEGAAATRVYRLVAEKPEDEEPSAALKHLREKFRGEGRLWACSNGQWSYVPVSDGVYMLGDATIPNAVANQFSVLDLPRRRGLEKISRVFGVTVLRARDIRISVDGHEPVPHGDVLNDELQRLKPYVLAIRFDATPDVTGLTQFKELRLVPCSEVTGTAVVEGHKVPICLEAPGESLVVDTMAYLVVPERSIEPSLRNATIAQNVANILAEVLDVERSSDFALLALAQGPANKVRVLSGILGHDAGEALDKARKTLEVDLTQEEAWLKRSLPPAPTITSQPEVEQIAQVSETETNGEDGPTAVPEKVQAEKEQVEATAPRPPVVRRVVTKRSSSKDIRRSRRVTDPNRCEELVERFEESQGRFPLRVSQLQGLTGFGCDVVSFSCTEERNRFVQSKGTAVDSVCRFIEVKGRSSSKGTLPLEGNELDAARRFRNRYYMYRVYEAVQGQEWQVVELADPFGYDWEVSYAVDLFRYPSTVYWTVRPVEQPEDVAQGQQP